MITKLLPYCVIFISCMHAQDLVQSLYEHRIIQHGSFTLKSGKISPLYIDMRMILSSPQLLSQVASTLHNLVQYKTYDRICGVPYGALPLATAISLQRQEPMIMVRKEIKPYGMQKQIEGNYNQGDRVLLIEDVITTGSSILETIALLESHGLIVEDILVVIDRQEGGVERLRDLGYAIHAVYTLEDIRFCNPQPTSSGENSNNCTYAQRAKLCTNLVAQKLFTIMAQKETNVVLAADVTTVQELLNLADLVGPYICALKVHIDILSDFTPACITRLKELAHKHTFLLIEDRKFADIGNTTHLQYTQGLYKIADWADLVTVHTLSGEGILDAMKQSIDVTQHAVMLIAQMSSFDNLADTEYMQRTYDIGTKHHDFVAGFITQDAPVTNAPYVSMTPGIHLTVTNKADQQFKTPHTAIYERNNDAIIVGRAIYTVADPVAAAIAYKQAGWQAYKKKFKLCIE